MIAPKINFENIIINNIWWCYLMMKSLVSILRKYKITERNYYQSFIRKFYKNKSIKTTTVILIMINNQGEMMKSMNHLK